MFSAARPWFQGRPRRRDDHSYDADDALVKLVVRIENPIIDADLLVVVLLFIYRARPLLRYIQHAIDAFGCVFQVVLGQGTGSAIGDT